MSTMIAGAIWLPIADGDPRALALYERHYSAAKSRWGRVGPARAQQRTIAGPGETMLLLTERADALFVWRKFINDSGQDGVNCAVFRYERDGFACYNSAHSHCPSRMIIEADDLAWSRWPGERLYTYVDPREVLSANPGYCFKRAGWRFCGRTKRGLHILEMRPEWTAA